MSDVLCNLCGLSCSLTSDNGTQLELAGLIDARVLGGYHSTPGNGHGALDDMTELHFSLCEFCLDWLFQCFRVPVAQFCNINMRAEEWKPAVERVEQDEWRSMKDAFLRRKVERDKARGPI